MKMICVLDIRKDLEEKLKPQEVWCRKIYNFDLFIPLIHS